MVHQFFPGTFFNFEATRIVSTTPTHGADIAEALTAISKIKDNDINSWHNAWLAAAERALSIAVDAVAAGNRPAARNAYLRAANYYRAAGYLFHSPADAPDPRALQYGELVVQTFAKAVPLLDHPVYAIEIPYTDVDGREYTLPGYLHVPSEGARLVGSTPILINTGGADSVQEELYHIYGATGPGLGYAVLTFEGPGQGIVLRRLGTHMRPDWEVVIATVLDSVESFAFNHPDLKLDLQRIGLAGSSMGGYFALRGAVDPRIKATVAIDPFIDMWEFATFHISPLFIGAWNKEWIGDRLVSAIIGFLTLLVFQMRWEVGLTAWFFGTPTPADTLKEMKKYTLKGGYLARIRSPVFVTGAAHSLYFNPYYHTLNIFNGLTGLKDEQKKLWMPEDPADGGLQAKVGAFALKSQRTFEFLDKVFDIKRPSLA